MSNVFPLILTLLFTVITSTNTQKSVNITCDTYRGCSTCITKHQCQFVVWKSKEKKILPVRKCVDITLNHDEVTKIGPLGNEKNDSHWDMKFFHDENKCVDHHVKEVHKIFSKLVPGNNTHLSLDGIAKLPSPSSTQRNITTPVNPMPIEKQDQGTNISMNSSTTNQNSQFSQIISENVNKSRPLITEKNDLAQNGLCTQSSFHVGSFIGGMVLILVLNVICVFGIRFYNARGSRNYNYLLWGESSN